MRERSRGREFEVEREREMGWDEGKGVGVQTDLVLFTRRTHCALLFSECFGIHANLKPGLNELREC